MIVFNTNQLNHFDFKNTPQQKSTSFDSQFNEKVRHLNSAIEHSSEKVYSQQKVDQPLVSFATLENKSHGAQYFKHQLSLVAQYAIKQYETLSHIESKQTTSAMLGINEYA